MASTLLTRSCFHILTGLATRASFVADTNFGTGNIVDTMLPLRCACPRLGFLGSEQKVYINALMCLNVQSISGSQEPV